MLVAVGEWNASMGPRLCSRGGRYLFGEVEREGERLQWGRGFVAAEACGSST